MGSQRPLSGMAEFYGLDELPSKPRVFRGASGPRKFYVQQSVEMQQVEASEDHQSLMADFAARAVRWFGEQAEEVQWHTLQFEVGRTGMEPNEDVQFWRWSVWVS